MGNEGVGGTGDAVQPALFNAFLLSSKDALLVFEAARRFVVPVVTRRLLENEKTSLVSSGTVFVFDENATGIKRWTDGALWSPSRIIGNYLVYREVDRKGDSEADKSTSNPASSSESSSTPNAALPIPIDPFEAPPAEASFGLSRHDTSSPETGTDQTSGSTGLPKELERALVGSLTSSYKFKRGGLVKKTISNGHLHIICYYTIEDVCAGRLRTPSSLTELAALEISSALLQPKNFRVPPVTEIDEVGNRRFVGEEADPITAPSSLGPLLGDHHATPVRFPFASAVGVPRPHSTQPKRLSLRPGQIDQPELIYRPLVAMTQDQRTQSLGRPISHYQTAGVFADQPGPPYIGGFPSGAVSFDASSSHYVPQSQRQTHYAEQHGYYGPQAANTFHFQPATHRAEEFPRRQSQNIQGGMPGFALLPSPPPSATTFAAASLMAGRFGEPQQPLQMASTSIAQPLFRGQTKSQDTPNQYRPHSAPSTSSDSDSHHSSGYSPYYQPALTEGMMPEESGRTVYSHGVHPITHEQQRRESAYDNEGSLSIHHSYDDAEGIGTARQLHYGSLPTSAPQRYALPPTVPHGFQQYYQQHTMRYPEHYRQLSSAHFPPRSPDKQ